jgi:hypothetical protein
VWERGSGSFRVVTGVGTTVGARGTAWESPRLASRKPSCRGILCWTQTIDWLALGLVRGVLYGSPAPKFWLLDDLPRIALSTKSRLQLNDQIARHLHSITLDNYIGCIGPLLFLEYPVDNGDHISWGKEATDGYP